RRDEPSPSTVMPVRSEMKKTCWRWGMGTVDYNSGMSAPPVLPLEKLRVTDVASVGGKNSSLGELISQLAASGVRVPGGFATTAQAFDDFIAHNKLGERIAAELAGLDVEDVAALAKAG